MLSDLILSYADIEEVNKLCYTVDTTL